MSFELGLPQQEYLRRVLVDLDAKIQSVAAANPFIGDASAGSIPTGLRLIPGLSSVTVEWSPVSVRNLLYYEVQFSRSSSFSSGVFSKLTTETRYTLQEATTNETWYVRVRSIAQGPTESGWSATLNTLSGLATFANLLDGAVSNPVIYQQTVFDPPDIWVNDTPSQTPYMEATFAPKLSDEGEWGEADITTIDGIVLPFATLEYDYSAFYFVGLPGGPDPPESYVSLLRDGALLGSEQRIDVQAPVLASSPFFRYEGVLTASSLSARPDTPGVGTFRYSFKVRLAIPATANGQVIFRPRRLTLTLLELRR